MNIVGIFTAIFGFLLLLGLHIVFFGTSVCPHCGRSAKNLWRYKYCPHCAKLLIANDSGVDKLEQIECPSCGKSHDFDFPKCPFCSYFELEDD